MTIYKDKKYFGIYLACVILSTILTISVAVFLIIMSTKEEAELFLLVLPFFAILGNVFAYNSLIGYIKTPDVLLMINNDEITFTPDRTKTNMTLKLQEIKGVDYVRPIICRSGKRIVLHTETSSYRLQDIDNASEAYERIVNLIKG